MKVSSNRFLIIDAFKAIASQLIVLHHLAAYGPISDSVHQLSPTLITWLYDYARIAVQIFFVIGGYFTARTIFSSRNNITSLTLNLFNKYLKLVVPFFFALILAITCAASSRGLADHEFIPDLPKLSQFLSHIFLLNGVLDFDSLLAGAWFIAIDFQLFLVMLCIAWLGGKTSDPRKAILVMITLISTASLFWFNRNPQYNDWALYFFGAYGMGATVYWSSQQGHSTAWLWLNVVLATLALLIDFRLRILIAVLVALILFSTNNMQIKLGFIQQKIIHYLGMISYSLFLVHFSVLMISNAIFSWLNITNPDIGIFFMVISWVGSLIVANFFYKKIEKPITSILKFSVKSQQRQAILTSSI